MPLGQYNSNPNSLKNLRPGVKVGSMTLKVDGLVQAAQAVQALPTQVRKNAEAAALRSLGTLSRRAEKIFDASPRRWQQSGVDAFTKNPGRVPRQTGKFTFGDRSGGAFIGTVFKEDKGGRIGFGFPNIDHADSVTQEIWRVVEYGLSGTEHKARALLPENARLVPKGKHRLPRKFEFSTPYQPGGNNQGYIYPGNRERDQNGKGFEGKHMIEQAWIDVEGIIADRYERAVTDAVAAFGR
jgi:hypothetical protein